MRRIKYPLIVSDFDGTLVKAEGTISEKNRRAIQEYVAAGGAFAISTGRLPSGILPRVRELGLTGMVCCCQGAIIIDVESGQVVQEGRLSMESTLAACKKMEEMDLHIHAYDLWEFYANRADAALEAYEKAVKTKAKLVLGQPLSSFLEEQKMPAYKLLAMVEPSESNLVLDTLINAELPDCGVTKSADFLVEIVNPNYSKGTAVAFLAKRYGVPIEKTIAIGDQRNDMPMIEKAGLGIAVCNADKALKKCADYVCEYTNEEDAVAKIIEKFGFYEEIEE